MTSDTKTTPFTNDIVRLGGDKRTNHNRENPLYKQWLTRWHLIRDWISDARGRPSEAARQLGVSKQTMSRWIHSRPLPPAWAFWALSIWHKQARRDSQIPIPNVRLGGDN